MNKKTYQIVETSILIAIGVIFEVFATFIPIFQMPQGGRVSIVLLPVIIISLRRGFFYGFISGVITGFFVFMFDGFFIHWGSIVFDYFLAFSLISIVALLKKDALESNIFKFILSITIASIIRYLMHSFSGVIFFGDFTDKDVWFYSFIVYNLPYNLGSYILMLIVGLAIYPSFKQIMPDLDG